MSAFLGRRFGFAIVTLFAVLTIIFGIVRILPGDPAQVVLGDQADAATVALPAQFVALQSARVAR